ncbi:MAG: helix-turn-helix transcriptional regulator [Alphaproteobacteria bacterium]|nr:helix-turn-helix transcriptional regulator [Alphaproteobacteria bacterium]
MRTIIAKQIHARMKAKNISTVEIERQAGLKPHAVRNILRGHSKRPSVDIVHAVAHVLDCTVDDLIQGMNIFTDDKMGKTIEELLDQSYKAGLLTETVKLIDAKVKKENHNLTIGQILTCVEETYLHSLQKGLNKVDKDFADWFMGLVSGYFFSSHNS